jgi:hypothetical protein
MEDRHKAAPSACLTGDSVSGLAGWRVRLRMFILFPLDERNCVIDCSIILDFTWERLDVAVGWTG